MKYGKTAQISIFILVSLFIVLLVVFLVSLVNQIESSEVSSSKQQAGSNPIGLETIQDEVDACLVQTLRRATIIASFTGGFIYDDSSNPESSYERYSRGVTFSDNSNWRDTLDSLNIDRRYLLNHVLFYHTSQLHFPPISNSMPGSYSRTVEEDIKKFIDREFYSCLDLDVFDSYGFQIARGEDDIGMTHNLRLIKGDYIVQIRHLKGIVGDSLLLFDGENEIETTVTEVNSDELITNINQDEVSSSNDLYGMSVVNINDSLTKDVSIGGGSITAQIELPYMLNTQTGQSTSTISSQQTLDSRLTQLQRLAVNVISKKSLDKSLKLSEIERFSDIDVDSLSNVDFLVSFLDDSQEYRHKVLTFVDNSSTILGENTYFNVAYENHAPYINLGDHPISCSNVGSKSPDEVVEEDERFCSIIAAENQKIEINLGNSVYEKQSIDIGENVQFIPKSVTSGSTEFNLEANGEMTFQSSQKTAHTFEIRIEDQEVSRDYVFRFLVGFPNNENNVDSQYCFDFTNFNQRSSLFPIDEEFTNKVFSNDDEDDLKTFVYSLSEGSSNTNAQLSLKDSCYPVDGSNFKVEYSIENGPGTTQTTNSLSEKIELPLGNSPYEVSAMVKDNNGNELLGEPMNLIVYPTQCLGPSVNTSFTDKSCCNIDNIRDHINSGHHPQQTPPSNVLRNEHELFNEEVIFTYDFEDLSFLTNSIIWNEFNERIHVTGHSKGNLQAMCGGEYPGIIPNLRTSSSGSIEHTIDSITVFGDEEFEVEFDDSDPSKPSKPKFKIPNFSGGEVCKFTQSVDNLFEFELQDDVRTLLIGVNKFKGTLRDFDLTSNPDVLCDDQIYGRNNEVDWQPDATNWVKGSTQISEGVFCSSGGSCNKYEVTQTKAGNKCVETRFNGEELEEKLLDVGTTCKTEIEEYDEDYNNVTTYKCQQSSGNLARICEKDEWKLVEK